jgi:hypothetical protein
LKFALVVDSNFGDDDEVEVSEGVFMRREETHTLYIEKWIKNGTGIYLCLNVIHKSFFQMVKYRKNILLNNLKI